MVIWQYDAARIHLYTTISKIYWGPWLKNYYGERGAQDDNSGFAPIIAYAWIDQDLKKSTVR